MGPQVWKIIGTAAAVLVGTVANKVVTQGWQKATGKEAPSDPTNPEVDWKEAIAFAALSGLVVGIAKLLTHRKAAAYYMHALERDEHVTDHFDQKLDAMSNKAD